MTESRSCKTKSGRVLSDDDLDRLSVTVETGDYDVEVLKTQRRGGRRWAPHLQKSCQFAWILDFGRRSKLGRTRIRRLPAT